MQVKPGIYQAKVLQIGFNQLSAGRPPLVQIEVALGTEWRDGAWVKLCADNAECPIFVCEKWLHKSNGDISDFNWKAMQEATGWDGVDFDSLQNLNVSKLYIQVTIELNKDNYLESTWINKISATPKSGQRKEVKKLPSADLKRWSSKPAASADLQINEDSIPF